jgi:hypothetical protein
MPWLMKRGTAGALDDYILYLAVDWNLESEYTR